MKPQSHHSSTTDTLSENARHALTFSGMATCHTHAAIFAFGIRTLHIEFPRLSALTYFAVTRAILPTSSFPMHPHFSQLIK